MDTILQWGIELILAIQAHRSPGMDSFFRTLTNFGGMWHLFVVPFVVWSLSYRAGVRMLLTLLFSVLLNFTLKDLLGQPRPFDMDSRIGPDRELGHGIPSGHAQHTAVEWSLIATWVGRRWFWVLAVAMILLIGSSRIYLGVHFPSDVIAGWLLAGALLWLHLRYVEVVAARLAALGVLAQISLTACVSALFVLAQFLVEDPRYIVGTGGLFLGAGCGITLCRRYLRAPEFGSWWQRGTRYLLGIIVLLLWLRLAGKLIPEQRTGMYFVLVYLSNAMGGLWVCAGAPALFQLLRLSPKQAKRNTEAHHA